MNTKLFLRNALMAIVGCVIGMLFMGSVSYGATILFPTGGGTGSSTLAGILIGNGKNPINTLTIGSNLTLSGTTLSATGGGSSFSTSSALNFEQQFGSWKVINGSFLTPTTTIGTIVGASSTFAALLNASTFNAYSSVGTSTFASGVTVGTQSLTVNQNNGFVGVNTAAPTNRFVVALGTNEIAQFNDGASAAGIAETNGSLISQSGMLQLTAQGTNSLVFGTGVTRNAMTGSSERARLTTGGLFGLATTTPNAQMTIASSTGSQLSLADGNSVDFSWLQRAVNNNFYLATSTYSASSSVAALFINGTNGAFTFNAGATSTFSAGINTTDINETGNATSTFFNGINVSSGCFSIAGICVGGSGGGSGTVAGTGSAGQIAYYTGATTVSPTSTIFINNTTGFTGFGGTTTPTVPFTFVETGLLTTPDLMIDGVQNNAGAEMALNRSSNAGAEANIDFDTNWAERWQLGMQNNGTDDFELWQGTTDAPVFTINQSSLDVNIGTTTCGNTIELCAWGDSSTGDSIFAAMTAASTSAFIVKNNGNVGINGTSSPYAKLSIASVTTGDDTPTIVIDAANTTNGNADMAFNRANSGTAEANIDFNTAGQTFWQMGMANVATAGNDFELDDGNSNLVMTILTGKNVTGFGTSTPFWELTSATGTAPQIALSDNNPADFAWTMRSIANSFFVATSTATATSTVADLFLNGRTGALTVNAGATSTFSSGISVTDISETGGATSTFFNGIDVSGGCFSIKGVCVGGSGGGSGTVTQVNTNSTINVDGTAASNFTTSGTLGINLNNANLWNNFINVTGTTGWYMLASSTLGYASSTNWSTVFGLNAGNAATTTSNIFGITAVGYGALATLSSTTAPTSGNTAVGAFSLYNASTSPGNTAVGFGALWGSIPAGVTTWSATGLNTAVGYWALASSTTGHDNTSVGYTAGRLLTTASNDTFVGSSVGQNVTSGSGNTFMGQGIAVSLTALTGANNVAIGFGAFTNANSNANSNVIIGQGAAGAVGFTGSKNSAVGFSSIKNITIGQNNSVLGYQTGINITTGYDNIILGETQNTGGSNLTTGGGNILMGYNPMTEAVNTNLHLNIGNILFGTIPATTTNTTYTQPTTGTIGIATSTPWGLLSLSLNASSTNQTAFVIASSTATATTTLFYVDSQGSVGIGTSVVATAALNITNAIRSLAGLIITTATNVANAFSIVNSSGVTAFNVSTVNTTGAMFAVGSSSPQADLTVQLNSGDTNQTAFIVASSTATATTTLFSVTAQGHIIASSTNPVLSGCGTAPTLAGDDTHGYITVGATATGCVLTFQYPYSNKPECTMTNESMSLTSAFAYVPSATAITVTQAVGLGGDVLDYQCEGVKGPN